MTETLGRLERVDLRNVWKTEAADFTTWLAGEENIKLLGETIGLDIEVQSMEQKVGPFRADILCKETEADHWVPRGLSQPQDLSRCAIGLRFDRAVLRSLCRSP